MAGDVLACVEGGGSSVETVLFAGDGSVTRVDGAVRPPGARLAIATPGLISGARVVAASSLGWVDVDPAIELGLGKSAEVVLNDAAAAALGEVALRPAITEAVYICVGTGVGAAVVKDGEVVGANLLGHLTGYSTRECLCTRIGCLETIAAGWALPDPLSTADLERAAEGIADALRRDTDASPRLIVLAGGIPRRYPVLAQMVAELSPERAVQRSAAPAGFKSAAAWGLRAALVPAAL